MVFTATVRQGPPTRLNPAALAGRATRGVGSSRAGAGRAGEDRDAVWAGRRPAVGRNVAAASPRRFGAARLFAADRARDFPNVAIGLHDVAGRDDLAGRILPCPGVHRAIKLYGFVDFEGVARRAIGLRDGDHSEVGTAVAVPALVDQGSDRRARPTVGVGRGGREADVLSRVGCRVNARPGERASPHQIRQTSGKRQRGSVGPAVPAALTAAARVDAGPAIPAAVAAPALAAACVEIGPAVPAALAAAALAAAASVDALYYGRRRSGRRRQRRRWPRRSRRFGRRRSGRRRPRRPRVSRSNRRGTSARRPRRDGPRPARLSPSPSPNGNASAVPRCNLAGFSVLGERNSDPNVAFARPAFPLDPV